MIGKEEEALQKAAMSFGNREGKGNVAHIG